MYKRIILLILSVFSTSLLIAATKTWDGGGSDNNWTTAANWDANVAPSAGDALVFSGSTRLTPNNDFAAATSFASITFSSGAGNFTLSGNSITIPGSASSITANNTSGTMTISLNIAFNTDNFYITTATSGNLTISGNLSNGNTSTSIYIKGTGNTTISGIISGNGALYIDTDFDNVTTLTAANTYTANTQIDKGGIRIKNSNALGTSNTLLMTNGTAGQPSLRLDGSGGDLSLPSSISINISSSSGNYGGVINEAGNNTIAGAISLNAGGGDSEFRVDAGTLTISGNVGLLSTDRSIILSGSGNGTFSGILSDRNVSDLTGLKKEGTGTWTISGTNTHSGTTTITAGILKINNTAALGSTTGITTVTSGAALDLNGITYSTAEPITINGTGVSSGGAIMNSNATAASFGGLITLGSNSSIEAGTGNISLTNAGTITGSGFDLALGGTQTGSLSSIIGTSAGTLTKNDAGTWTISGASTYTGATTINAGTLKLGAAGVIPNSSAVTVTGTLDMNTFSETVGSIAGAGTIDNVSGAGTPTLTCGGDGTSTTFSGVIKNTTGTLALTKSGSGTLSLTGTNLFTGTTTISAGTLEIGDNTTTGSVASTSIINNSELVFNRSNAITCSSVISGTGNLTQTNTTGDLTLSGANTYSGTTTVDASCNLYVDHNTALGNTTGGTSLNANSGTLYIKTGITVTGETLTMNTTLAGDMRSYLKNASGTATWNGTITLAGDNIANIYADGTFTISGTIGGSASALYLRGTGTGNMNATISVGSTFIGKTDAGTWILNSSGNTWGVTKIFYGNLTLGITNAIPTTSLLYIGQSGAYALTFDLNGYNQTLSGITVNASGTLTRQITNNGSVASTLTVNNTSNYTYSELFTNGSSALNIIKSGSGTFTVSGANTYTGTTTVSAGIFKIGSTTALGTTAGATTVSSGGALDLNGQTYASSEGLTLNGTGVSSGGALMNSSATAATYPGLITLGSASSIISTSGDITISNTGTISGATFGLTLGGASNGTIASIIGTTTGTLTKQDAGTWTLSGANTFSGGTTLSTGQLNINNATALGTGTFTISNGTIINNTSGGSITLSTNNAQTWNGDFTFTGTNALNLGTGAVAMGSSLRTITTTASTLTVGGTISGTGGLTKAGAGTMTLGGITANNWTGPTTISGGTFNLGTQSGGDYYQSTSWTVNSGATLFQSSSNIIINSAIITVNSGGTWNLSSRSECVGYIAGAGSISNTGGLFVLDVPSTGTGSDFSGVISGSAQFKVRGLLGSGKQILSGLNTYTGQTVIENGTLSINTIKSVNGGASSLGAPTTSANGTIDIGSTTSTGILEYTGSAQTTDRIINLAGTSGGATIDQSGTGLLKFTSDFTAAATAKTLTLQGSTAGTGEISGIIFSGSTNVSLLKSGSGTWTNSGTSSYNNITISAGTLAESANTVNVAGNFSNSATFTPSTSTIIMSGTTAQTISAANFYNLTINNTSGGVSLTGDINVSNNLTLTSGILTTSTYIANLGSTGSISEINPSATNPSSYVTGYVRATRNLLQNVTNTFGGIGVSLTESTQVSNSTEVTRRTGTASVGVGNQSILRYFDITPNVDANLNGTMAFSYIDAELNGQAEDSLKIYKSTNSGSTWAKQASSSVNTGSNSLSLSGITSFSRWTASNKTTNPLPVEFISFTATKGTDATVLKWETAQEINNDYFEIERSHDGINFEKITSIKGVGTTNSISNYNYLDKSTNQTLATYYRLKQVDFDKKTEYSNIVFVNGQTNYQDIKLFPNPIEEGKILYATMGNNDEGIIKVSVFDMTGKLIHDFLIDNVVANSNIIIENQNHSLKKGMYIIEIKSLNNDYKQKLEVK